MGKINHLMTLERKGSTEYSSLRLSGISPGEEDGSLPKLVTRSPALTGKVNTIDNLDLSDRLSQAASLSLSKSNSGDFLEADSPGIKQQLSRKRAETGNILLQLEEIPDEENKVIIKINRKKV